MKTHGVAGEAQRHWRDRSRPRRSSVPSPPATTNAATCTRPPSTSPRSGSGCETSSRDLRGTPGTRVNESSTSYPDFALNAAGSYAPGGSDTRFPPYWASAGNGNNPGNSTSACIRGTSLAPLPDAVALARGSARLGPAGAARHRRRCGGRVRLGNGRRQRRVVLRRGGPQHVGKLARLHLRGVRSSRDRDCRQAAGRALGAGPIAAGLRLSHLGAGPATGGRGRAHHPGAVPGGPSAGRACGRPDRRGGARRHAHYRAAEPGQRIGLAADPAAGARRRRHGRRAAHRVGAAVAAGRRLGRPGVPDEDDPGLAGPARAGRRLSARRARGETAYPVRARRTGRAGHRSGLPLLDDRGLAGPVP